MDGKRIGQGTMRFANSDIVYTGEWQDSMRHGKGKLTFDKAGKCFYEGMLPSVTSTIQTLLQLAASFAWWGFTAGHRLNGHALRLSV